MRTGPGLRALVEAAGAEPIDLGIARDDLDDVLARLRRGIDAEADAIIVAGGVSVGPVRRRPKRPSRRSARVELWRVAVQPGKPFAFGGAPAPSGGRRCCSGCPATRSSSFVTFELFVRPAIRALAGRRRLLRADRPGVLVDAATKAPGRRAFLRVAAERDADGRPVAGRCRPRRVRCPAGRRAGEPRPVARSRPPTPWRSFRRRSRSARRRAAVDLWWLDRA